MNSAVHSYLAPATFALIGLSYAGGGDLPTPAAAPMPDWGLLETKALFFNRPAPTVTFRADPVHPEAQTFDFAREITTIYAKLLARQEPLGSEFEAAIFDDIESLYES